MRHAAVWVGVIKTIHEEKVSFVTCQAKNQTLWKLACLTFSFCNYVS